MHELVWIGKSVIPFGAEFTVSSEETFSYCGYG